MDIEVGWSTGSTRSSEDRDRREKGTKYDSENDLEEYYKIQKYKILS